MSKTSAIRVTVSRHLSESEKEWVRNVKRIGDKSIAFTNWDGLTYKWTSYPFHIRLSKRGKFWIHSDTVEARRLYKHFLTFLENNFVNIHPTAVRTFSTIPATKDNGWLIDDVFYDEAARRGWTAPQREEADPGYCAPCGGRCIDESEDEEEEWEVVGLVDA